MFTNYEDIKGNANCKNRGGLVGLGVTEGHRQCHHSTERIQLPTWH